MLLASIFILYYRVAIPFTREPLLAEAPYPIMIDLDPYIEKRGCVRRRVRKHFTVLDKITRQFIFYGIISIVSISNMNIQYQNIHIFRIKLKNI